MKASPRKKGMRPSVKKVAPMPVFIDEFHMLAGSEMKSFMRSNCENSGAGGFVVTQAIGRGKRGKQVFVGSMRYAKTGLPFPPAPKKFLPAQVLRRQAAVKA